MPHTLTPETTPRIVAVTCDRCEGSGRVATERDWPDFTPSCWRTCPSCMSRGIVLVNARDAE